MKSEV